MQIDYRRDLNHNYLILHGEGEPDTGSYQIRMLLTNTIPGLLGCKIGKLDNHTLFYYDITSRQSIRTMLLYRPVDDAILRGLFEHLFETLEEMSKYLLNVDGILLDPELIFTDAETQSFSFCYLPGHQREERTLQESMKELMEYFLPKLNHQESSAVVLGYGLYREITSGAFAVERVKNLLYQPRNSQDQEIPEEEETAFFRSEEEARKSEEEATRRQILDSFFGEEEVPEKGKIPYLAEGGLCVLMLAVVFLLRWIQVPVIWYLVWFAAAVLAGGGFLVWKHGEKLPVLGEAISRWKGNQEKKNRKEGKSERVAEDAKEDLLRESLESVRRDENLFNGKVNFSEEKGKIELSAKKRIERQKKENWKKEIQPEERSDPKPTAGIAKGQAGKGSGEVLQNARSQRELLRKEQTQREQLQRKEAQREELQREELQREETQRKVSRRAVFPNDFFQGGSSQKEVSREGSPQESIPEEELYEKTELLCSCHSGGAHLIPLDMVNLPVIEIQEETGRGVLLGKLASAVDFVIPVNTVSRIHARFFCRERSYFLTDLNSRNGTFVNGELLQGEEERELQEGDEVTFGDCRYQFKIKK